MKRHRPHRVACVLALCSALGSIPAQSGDPRGLWVRPLSGAHLAACDQLGRPASFGRYAQLQAPRRALDESVWCDLGSSAIQRYSTANPGGNQALSLLGASGQLVEIVTDATSRGLVLTDIGELLEVNPDLTLNRSWQLGFACSALEVGSDGAVWVGLVNQPTALLARFDRATGTRQIIALPAALGQVTDILPDARPSGGHVFVCGDGGGHVAEIDPALQLVGDHLTAAGTTLTDLDLDLDGTVWASGPRGAWQIDPLASTIRQVVGTAVLGSDLLTGLSFDGEGGMWTGQADGRRGDHSLTLWDASRTTVVYRNTSDRFAGDMEDAGGTWLLQVLDPRGDQDGDGIDNVTELATGTDPRDDQSTPAFDLDAEADAPQGGMLRAHLRGAPGLAVLALHVRFFPPPPPVVLPGVLGEYRLPLGADTLFSQAISVPGTYTMQVPGNGFRLPLDLTLQALQLPVFGNTPRFSDLAQARVRGVTGRTLHVNLGSTAQRDDAVSGGPWVGGIGLARVGGQGVLGSFDPTLGTLVGPDTWQFSTDDQTFPAGSTLFGNAIRVTSGVFEFTDFIVPAGVTVRFTGSNPVVLKVRGEARIDGSLEAPGGDAAEEQFNGRARPGHPSGWIATSGQFGGLGGPGAGAGGQGADGCELDGDATFHAGRPGEAVRPAAGSGYLGLSGLTTTAGPGSTPFPASARRQDVTYSFFSIISAMVAAGGGGGGWQGVGAPGRALATFQNVPADLAPDSGFGTALQFLQPPMGATSLDHYLVGGAGGGGGGSQPTDMSVNSVTAGMPMHAGAGGGGGGGALALRLGGELMVGATGTVSVRGGRAAHDLLSADQGPPAPGGGGSGGSLLIQLDDITGANFGGRLDLHGGEGGSMVSQGFSGSLNRSEGGSGGHGLLRVEAGGTLPGKGALGNVEPLAALQPGSLAALHDTDPQVGQQSRWLQLGEPTRAPALHHYEITVDTSGLTTTYTDDPARYNPANLPGLPLRLLLQGAELGPDGQVLRVGHWRDLFGGPAGLAVDGTTDAVRFMVLFDRRVASDTQVTAVRFVYEQ